MKNIKVGTRLKSGSGKYTGTVTEVIGYRKQWAVNLSHPDHEMIPIDTFYVKVQLDAVNPRTGVHKVQTWDAFKCKILN